MAIRAIREVGNRTGTGHAGIDLKEGLSRHLQ